MDHFSLSEFACKCGCGLNSPAPRLIAALDQLRDLVERPIIINDACRCASHNRDVGGQPNSQHLYGRAADIRCPGLALPSFYQAALKIPDFAEGGLGYYPVRGFIHADVRRGRARWGG